MKICPKCGKETNSFLASMKSFKSMSEAMSGLQREWMCRNCGHRWEDSDLQ